MPVHFSNNKYKPRAPINLSSEKEYRVTAYIGLKRPWNDSLGRYEPYSESEQKILDEAHQYMQSIGLQLSVQIQEKTGAESVKDFPTVGRIQPFYVNTPRFYDEGNFGSQPLGAPAQEDGNDGW